MFKIFIYSRFLLCSLFLHWGKLTGTLGNLTHSLQKFHRQKFTTWLSWDKSFQLDYFQSASFRSRITLISCLRIGHPIGDFLINLPTKSSLCTKTKSCTSLACIEYKNCKRLDVINCNYHVKLYIEYTKVSIMQANTFMLSWFLY